MVKAGLDTKDRIKCATIHSLAFEHMQYHKPYKVNTLFMFAKSIGEKSGIHDDRNMASAKTPLERSLAFYQVQRSLMVDGELPSPEGVSREIIH